MGKDPSENRLEEKPDVFVDVINNLVLGGKQLITEEELVPLPTRAYVRKTDGELRSGMRDVQMESRLSTSWTKITRKRSMPEQSASSNIRN